MKSTTIRIDQDTMLRLREFRGATPKYFESYNEVIRTLLEIVEALKADKKLKDYL